ncbi:molybdopterin molybdotransferase MoeA [Lysobacter xanthus]
MIDYDVALQRLLELARTGAVEHVAPESARGRVLAAPLVSAESLPPFDNSAMDGFAVQCRGSTLQAGAEFDVVGASAAGDGAGRAAGGAWEIMTGAPLPAGFDAIVPVEQVTASGEGPDGRAARIRLDAGVTPGQHVRRAGEDVAAGEVLAGAGTIVDPALVMLCAATGVARLAVHPRPRVALINTGRELVDDPSRPLAAGEIRNSNGPFLAARLESAGAKVVARATVGDDIDAFLDALEAATGADLIVSTGAVSMGRFDFVPDALARVGARTLFHKVRIRPGKPILAAVLTSGALFFGLPGNPASTAVGLRFFVEPVLRAMLGLPVEQVRRLPLLAPYAKRVPLRMHLKARVALDSAGRAAVEILGGQESFRIRPLLDANAWAVVDADVDALDAGAPVQVVTRGHLDALEIAA